MYTCKDFNFLEAVIYFYFSVYFDFRKLTKYNLQLTTYQNRSANMSCFRLKDFPFPFQPRTRTDKIKGNRHGVLEILTVAVDSIRLTATLQHCKKRDDDVSELDIRALMAY